MLQFAAIFLAQMNTVALAEEPYKRAKPWRYEKYMGTVDEVIHNGSTELPLYSNFSGRPGSLTALPFTNAEEKTREWLTVFTSSFPYIVVSSEFANYMGAKIKTTNKTLIPIWKEYKLGGQIDYATFDELVIGNMTLQNVTALIRDYEKGTDYIQSFDDNVHILIGFNQLESAYQVLPSQGTIKIEGTADGSALISEYGNAVGYQNFSGGRYKFLKEDVLIQSGTLLIDATVDGEEQKILLETAQYRSLAQIEDGTETFHFNDSDAKYSSYAFGNVTESALTTDLGLELNLVPYDGVMGLDLLNNYDIAVDVGNQQLALRPIQTEQKRANFVPVQLAQVQANIDEKINADSEEGEETSEPTAKDYAELMSFQVQMGQLSAAYGSAIKRTELKPGDCTAWLDASDIALKLNKVSEAKDHAEKASTLYHRWWSIDLISRQDIESRQDKMKPEAQAEAEETQKSLSADAEPVWHYIQPGSCHEADAQLAWAYIASDELEKVLPLYRERIDLDEKLAMATAYSAMLENNLPLAQETLRQALKLGKGYSSIAEAGLALWYADIGDEEQFQKLMSATQTGDFLYQGLEMDNYRQFKGSDKAISYIQRRLKSDPSDLEYHYLYVRELRIANAGSAYDDAVANADAAFQSELLQMISNDQPLTEDTYGGLALYARYLILTGRTEQAKDIINGRLKSQNFGHAYLAMTLADFYASTGDMSAVKAELAKLKLDGRDILSLSSAMLLRSTPSASVE